MDYLWTPWRYQYMKEAASGAQPDCIFCEAAARTDDSETLVVYRGKKAFIILNRYPYTSGHVMIVPYAHLADLSAVDPEALSEMRSEEHTSELQSHLNLVCRLLLEKKTHHNSY